AFRDWLYVVNLPSPLLGLAVLASLHARTTGVLAEPCVVWFGFCLCPYSFDGLLIEGFSTGVCIWLSCHDGCSFLCFGLVLCVLGRIRISPKAVFVADLSIPTV